MAKFRETKIPIAEFLEAYRCQPCLYNSLLDTYKNRVAREEAYEAIISALKIPQLTVLDIKLKIKSVRTVYTKELRILMREKEQGRRYEPKLFWFKHADSFLRPVSLSHCKRLKNKHAPVDSSCTSSTSSSMAIIKKQHMQHNTIEEKEQQPKEKEQLQPNDSYLPELVAQGSKRKMSIGTNTNPPPEAGCQTEDLSANKMELMIDEANTLGIMEQQHQQEEEQQLQSEQEEHQQQQQQRSSSSSSLRKLKYIPYPQMQHSQQSQPHRLSTPFTSPSPSQQLDLATSTSVGPCYAGPNAVVTSSGGGGASGEDDFMIFGQSIASQLRTIPDPYSRSVAKLRIQQVLFEAETGQSSEAVNPHLHSF
ncbi:putative cyclin-dependent serine/threonine-protein kinase DDB_G0272797/DDB_G0274007 [Drosophila grimshawi]|uniref:GH24542 n=1 Tax=Drosophila grimshawi TaxID=7222 RepID=B4JLX8_DROGR|nr:putative cyclin-dependent serine/threonine-protein kinase DDB_G0272797/DDB_G0274007 [Drosophila grimshawi]EDV91739.1 GH24542 [Drosophila grimshawi]